MSCVGQQAEVQIQTAGVERLELLGVLSGLGLRKHMQLSIQGYFCLTLCDDTNYYQNSGCLYSDHLYYAGNQ